MTNTTMHTDKNKIWEPSKKRLQSSQMYDFLQWINRHIYQKLDKWEDLHNWSIENTNEFWKLLSKYVKIKWINQGKTPIYQSSNGNMLETKWFEGWQLNFADNLLLYPDEKLAIITYTENQKPLYFTRKQIYHKVSYFIKYLRTKGLKKGNIVAALMTNNADTIIAMLAVAACGGVWSSCSPDFGANSLIDRFKQINPKFLFFHPEYSYKGANFDCMEKIEKCIKQVTTLKLALCFGKPENLNKINFNINTQSIQLELLQNEDTEENSQIFFENMQFSDPLYILFSSGTTGKPKGIVHSVGGTLLQHKKELMLHIDLKPLNKILFYTTCGWMMWNWMASSLSIGATIVLYDGSPMYPDTNTLWKICEQEKLHVLGISPKYIQECNKINNNPKLNFNLQSLKTILSTGSTLLPKQYEWIYKEVKTDVHLISMSGGTDIISCFVLGNPLKPVYIGEIQSAGLGMSISAKNLQGEDIQEEKGELVCSKPFVSMPVYFINDINKKKYKNTYFKFFPNIDVWRHGDFIKTTKNGGYIIYGRSDSTLNPGGIRIGTSEIYNALESINEIKDMIVTDMLINDDTSIVLCVKMHQRGSLDKDFITRIKSNIRESLTKRHVPKHVHEVSEIPSTLNGKKSEISVKNSLEGKKVDNISALANSWVLDEYYAIGKYLRKIFIKSIG